MQASGHSAKPTRSVLGFTAFCGEVTCHDSDYYQQIVELARLTTELPELRETICRGVLAWGPPVSASGVFQYGAHQNLSQTSLLFISDYVHVTLHLPYFSFHVVCEK